ncbi:sugar transporter [Violaceomyces palustris]|uniref:Sugar transporter n=1 Tax=Violaceomyces palustris TaxID=1673888 RepID=A0ACD0NV28_9BASI|nr:sugar transporter [Violaceomyces palustris]
MHSFVAPSPSETESRSRRNSINHQNHHTRSTSLNGLYGGTTTLTDADEALDNVDEDLLGEDNSGYTPYLGKLTFLACLGGLQFGWDTGMASGMLVAIHQDLGHTLSSGEQELVVSATTVGAIVGSVIAGRVSDWLGRKKVMVGAAILFLLGSLEQAASQVVRELVLGRVLVGVGVGMASMVVPTYLAEVAPTSVRGRIVGINNLLVTGGQVVAYVVDAAFYNLPKGWRWMCLAGGLPAVVQLVGLLYLDESPRWLVGQGKVVSARSVLERIYPNASPSQISAQIDKIQVSMQTSPPSSINRARRPPRRLAEGEEEDNETTSGGGPGSLILNAAASKGIEAKGKLKALLTERGNRKALILACGLQFFQQVRMVGFNSLMYFSSRLLLMAGFTSNPNAAAIGIAVANCVGTAIAMRYIDSWGRRKLLLWTTAAMALSLVLLGFSFKMIDTGSVTDDGSPPNTKVGATGVDGPVSAWAYVSLASMILFTLNYALGIGIVPWLVQSEVFAGPVRGLGGGLATATNWSANLVISATYLDLVKLITPSGSFWLYAGVALLSWWFTYSRLPEMKGVSLSDVQERFGERVDVERGGGYLPVRGGDDEDEGFGGERGA